MEDVNQAPETIDEPPQQSTNESQPLPPDEGYLSTQFGSDDEQINRLLDESMNETIMGQDTQKGREMRKLLKGTGR